MRTVFEEEEEELASSDPSRRRGEDHDQDYGPEEQDRELTISSTTLLVIFFGLVLVCGLFFGLGYTFGRRTPADASQLAAAAVVTQRDSQPAVSASKPSAASQPASTPTPGCRQIRQPRTPRPAPTADSIPSSGFFTGKAKATEATAPQAAQPASAGKAARCCSADDANRTCGAERQLKLPRRQRPWPDYAAPTRELWSRLLRHLQPC